MIKAYLAPIIKWWWLLAAAALLAGGTSYYLTRHQPPVYTSSTRLVIGQIISNPNPSNNDFYLNQQLAGLYSNLAFTDPVRNGTMKALGLTWLPNYAVKMLGNNQFLEIDVTDTSPQRAMLVAQELAKQLILVSPGGSEGANQTRTDFINAQINDMQNQINQTQSQISQKQAALASMQSAQAISQAQQDEQALESKLTMLQTSYANLVASSQSNIANSLQIIEPANLPVSPVGPGKYLIIALAGAIALVLAGGGRLFNRVH